MLAEKNRIVRYAFFFALWTSAVVISNIGLVWSCNGVIFWFVWVSVFRLSALQTLLFRCRMKHQIPIIHDVTSLMWVVVYQGLCILVLVGHGSCDLKNVYSTTSEFRTPRSVVVPWDFPSAQVAVSSCIRLLLVLYKKLLKCTLRGPKISHFSCMGASRPLDPYLVGIIKSS